jgi:hypothetical protein
MLFDPLPKPKNHIIAIISLILDLIFPGIGMLFIYFDESPEQKWLLKSLFMIFCTTLSWIFCFLLIGFIPLIILLIIAFINNVKMLSQTTEGIHYT